MLPVRNENLRLFLRNFLSLLCITPRGLTAKYNGRCRESVGHPGEKHSGSMGTNTETSRNAHWIVAVGQGGRKGIGRVNLAGVSF